VIKHHCRACEGRGAVEEARKLTLTIPAGVDDGMRLRLRGEGQPGDGAPAGDLLIDLSVKPHPWFRRDGNDLLLAYPVTFTQAALGAELEVPTLDGTDRLTIPAGTQTHSVFRLRGRGIDDGRRAGDLVVQVMVRTPEKPSRDQKKLFRQLAELEGEPEPWWKSNG
jgi:molecular chaperone DnaJ